VPTEDLEQIGVNVNELISADHRKPFMGIFLHNMFAAEFGNCRDGSPPA
jgi:hypothetical protein